MKKIISSLFFLLVFVGSCLGDNAHANNSAIYLSPLRNRYAIGDDFAIKVLIKPGDNVIEKVSAKIEFPEDFLQVEKMQTASYFITTTQKNYFDNQNGSIFLEGRIDGGLIEDGYLATIEFKIKNKGSARLNFDRSTRGFNGNLEIPLRILGGNYTLYSNDGKNKSSEPTKTDWDDKDDEEDISDNEDVINTLATSSILSGQPPLLFGKTNIPGARVELIVDDGLVNDRVYANQNGDWNWSLPQDLLPGFYAVKITTIDPKDKAKRHIDWQEVETRVVDAEKALYKIIIATTTYRLEQGETLPLSLKILHLGTAEDEKRQLETTNFKIRYYIEDPEKNIFYDDNEDVTFSGIEKKFDKIIEIPQDTIDGTYKIYVSLWLGDEWISQDSGEFTVGNTIFSLRNIIVTAVIVIIATMILVSIGRTR